MLGMGVWAALAVAAGAAQGSAKETVLASQQSSGTTVYAQVAGDRLVLRSVGPVGRFVSYSLDANGDERINEDTDVTYVVAPGGELCAGTWISSDRTGSCGSLRSAARASERAIGDKVERKLEIPLAEASRNVRTLRIRIGMNREVDHLSDFAWMRYDLATGEVQGMAAPAATPTSAAPPANDSEDESEIGAQPSTGMRAYARVVGGRLVLRSVGVANSQAAYAFDVDANGAITEVDPYFTVQKDGTLCAGTWYPARNTLECGRPSRATGSQEVTGEQVVRRVEIPLGELPRGPGLRIMLMMNKPQGGNAQAWVGYDTVTGEVKALQLAATPKPAAAAATSAATATTAATVARPAGAPSCPPTKAELAQWLSGRRVLERKAETPFAQSGSFTLFAQDGEDKIDPAGMSVFGARPLRMTAIIHEGKPNALWSHFAGHDIKPFEAAFRAEYGGRQGKVHCDAMECRWQLVAYPNKPPKGVLGDVSISLYNLTTTETTLSCKYGD